MSSFVYIFILLFWTNTIFAGPGHGHSHGKSEHKHKAGHSHGYNHGHTHNHSAKLIDKTQAQSFAMSNVLRLIGDDKIVGTWVKPKFLKAETKTFGNRKESVS